MFKSIGREIRSIPGHVVALFFAAPALIYLDGIYVVAWSFRPGLAHWVLLALSACCLAWLYADGAAPRGPWEREHSNRRRDALQATILVLAALVVCAAAHELLAPFQPAAHVETWDAGKSTLTYPEVTGIGDAVALAAGIALSFANLAIMLLGLCAPACAAQHGLGRSMQESWRAWRRCYFRLCGLCMLAWIALIPAFVLALPLQVYWAAAGFGSPGHAAQIRLAIDLCNRVGPGNIALGGAAATLLFGIVLWSYSRAVARLIERPRG